jgi:uncharacterized protein YlxW (UPF0749 family)
MSLLNNLMEHPLDEGYEAASRAAGPDERPPSRFRPLPMIALAAVGFLLAVAAVQNYRSAPELEKQRDQLIARIDTADDRLGQLRGQQSALAREVRALQASGLGAGGATALQRQLDQLELSTGTIDTTGPGLKIVVDDAKDTSDEQGKVLDVDLQQLVNGLWVACAEAISVNGHRLTSLTAIRGAGTAITVDYSSLTRPYVIHAIGDNDTLPARFLQTGGGQWMQFLVSYFGVRMTPTPEESLLVPGDSSISLRYAKGVGER